MSTKTKINRDWILIDSEIVLDSNAIQGHTVLSKIVGANYGSFGIVPKTIIGPIYITSYGIQKCQK